MEAISGHPVQRYSQQRIIDGTGPPPAIPGVLVVLRPGAREPGTDWVAPASSTRFVHLIARNDNDDDDDDDDNHDGDDDDDDKNRYTLR